MSDTPRTDALWSDNSVTPDELADLSRELERRVVELEGWIGNVRAAYRVFICASSESERREAIALLDLALRKMGTLGFPMPGGGAIVHGKTCDKAQHIGEGHLHAEDDDKPYDVDGVSYCGRCHVAIPGGAK